MRGKRSGKRRNLELDVEHSAEQLGGQIVDAHLVSGDLVHGRLHLKVPKSAPGTEQTSTSASRERG